MPRAKPQTPVLEDEPDEQLDQVQETDNLTGAIPEGEIALARSVASKMGWTPKEEWKRDPAKWVDAPEFLENTPRVLAELKERSDRTARAAAEAIEDERRRKVEAATRVIEESEDPAERRKAATELQQHAGPPPQTQEWIGRNPWFNTDVEARNVAARAMQRAFAIGLSIEDQIAAGEEAARREFPHYFSLGTEQRLSDVRRQSPNPPQVQQGSRVGASQPKEKGWSDIPRADRDAFELHLVKHFMAKGLKREEAQAQYAASYWREGVLPPDEREEDPWVREKKSNPWGRR